MEGGAAGRRVELLGDFSSEFSEGETREWGAGARAPAGRKLAGERQSQRLVGGRVAGWMAGSREVAQALQAVHEETFLPGSDGARVDAELLGDGAVAPSSVRVEDDPSPYHLTIGAGDAPRRSTQDVELLLGQGKLGGDKGRFEGHPLSLTGSS